MTSRQKRRFARQRDQRPQAAAPRPQPPAPFQLDEKLRARRDLLVKCIPLSNESQDKFRALANDYLQEFQPQGIVEIDLVEDLIVNRWRHSRFLGIENALLDLQMDRDSDEIEKTYEKIDGAMRVGLAFEKQANRAGALKLALQTLDRLNRTHQRTLKLLREIQETRRAEAETGEITNEADFAPPPDPSPEKPPNLRLVPKPEPESPVTSPPPVPHCPPSHVA